jgi:hypothetical protein
MEMAQKDLLSFSLEEASIITFYPTSAPPQPCAILKCKR